MLKVALVVPVYKVEKYIRKCIDSLLSQTYADIEIVLVDDGSPDECGRICDCYAENDCRVHVIHQTNQGLSAARNVGIDYIMASSDSAYIGFVDSDDWVSPHYVEELVAGVQLSGTAACASCAQILNDGQQLVRYCSERWEVVDTQDYWSHPDPLTVVACSKLYPRSFFRTVRFPVGRIHEDVFTVHKLLFQSSRVAIKFTPIYYYRCRNDSIVNKAWTESRLDEVYGLMEQCAYLREHAFERAYLSSRAKLLGALSGRFCNEKVIGTDRADAFKKILHAELEQRSVPFWQNRAYYRNTMNKWFAFRWAGGVVEDLLKMRGKSWLMRELIPTLKEIAFVRHAKKVKKSTT